MKADFDFLNVWNNISQIDQVDELWKIRVDGSAVWPVIREALAEQWFLWDFGIHKSGEKTPNSTINKAKAVIISIVGNINVLVRAHRHGFRTGRAHKVLCIAYDHIRRDTSPRGELMDVYVDYLLPSLSHLRPVVFNNWTSKAIKGQFFWPLNIGDNWYMCRRAMDRFYQAGKRGVDNRVASAVRDIERVLCSKSFSQLIPDEVLNRVRPLDSIATSYLYDISFYSKLLDSLGTKVIVITGRGKFAWQEAARKKQIASVTLQQGLISGISAYNNIDKYAAKYKSNLPIPTLVTVNGQYFVDELTRGGFWDSSDVVPIGFARLSKALEEHQPDFGQERYRRQELRILVTSDHHIAERMSNYIEKVAAALGPDSGKVKWIIKRHPWKDNIEAYVNKNYECRIIDEVKDQTSLYALLRSVDLHLTSWSATTLEAIPYGVPTLFMDKNGSRLMSSLADRGIAVEACDENVSVALLKAILNSDKAHLADWHRNVAKQSGYFWADGPQERFAQLLESILS